MTKLKVLSAALAFAGAVVCAEGAFAATASQIITLTATVPGICTVGGGASATTSAVIPIVAATDLPNTTLINVAGLGAVICNENTQLTLTTANGGLTGPTSATGFANIINYTATATYGTGGTSTTQSLTTTGVAAASAGPSAASTMGASSSQTFAVTVTPLAGSSPLVLGSYSDTLTVIFTPHT